MSRAFSFMSENPRNARVPNSVAKVAGSTPDVGMPFQIGGGKPPVSPESSTAPTDVGLYPDRTLVLVV